MKKKISSTWEANMKKKKKKKSILRNILGVSPRRAVNGCHRPRVFSALVWIALSFEAATIFIAFVIFWILFTLFIRFLTVYKEHQHYQKSHIWTMATTRHQNGNVNYMVKVILTNLSWNWSYSQRGLLPAHPG